MPETHPATPTPAESAAPAAPSDWLALGPAARVVGVDPDTLRRWADAGRVRAFTTPGGHRRFPRSELERVLAVRRSGRRTLAALGGTTERFTRAYGRQYRQGLATPSVVAGDDAARAAFRTDGRRLVETLLAYLDAAGAGQKAALEADAYALVDQTARRLADAGMSAVEATGAFVTARGPFLAALEALGRRRSLDAPAVMQVYAEAASLLDRLLLRFSATFHRPAAED